MAITDWPCEERPREKLLSRGAQSLSDAELLAIFLRVGMPGKSAVDLARELLAHFGSLESLFKASLQDFSSIAGMGTAKYAQLKAVLEMARRAMEEALQHKDAFTSPQSVRQYLQLRLRGLEHEEFHALFLDNAHQLIASEALFRGSINQTRVYPRELARRALQHNASAVIVAHNHPSGNPETSAEDITLTRQLREALSLIDIRLLDHFIIAANQITSLAEHGDL